MVAGIIIGAILVIVLWYFVALEFRNIAALKGYDEPKYFWWTFLLGILGILMVIALPNNGETNQSVYTDVLPEL